MENQFFRSLLRTFLDNLRSDIKVFPIATEYIFLLETNVARYNKAITKMNTRKFKQDQRSPSCPTNYERDCTIKSINRSERCSVAIFYYPLDDVEQEDVDSLVSCVESNLESLGEGLGLYTYNCRRTENECEGVIVEIHSVEDRQNSEDIRAKWENMIAKEAHSTENGKLSQLFTAILKKGVTRIQVRILISAQQSTIP